MADTIVCKHCGEVNDGGNAVCVNCSTPLTAYGGQVGQEKNYTGKLAAQVEALEIRPPVVVALTGFNVLFALAVPLWSTIAAWTGRLQVNAEGTNAVLVAANTFTAILKTVTLLPVVCALCIVAYFTWTQRPWAWTANVVVLAVIAILALMLHGFSPLTFIWIGLAGGFAYYWFQKPVKAWFGLE